MSTIDMDGVPRRPRPGGRGGRRGPSLPQVSLTTIIGALVVLGLGLLVLVLVFTGNLGVINITHEQVAVKINYVTGSREVITTPGFRIYIPFLEEVFTLDRTPQKFLMEGRRTLDSNHTPFLTVRANDGSNFWFEELEIQYAIIPSAAAEILDDSGIGEGFKRDWIRGYARSVLRDEFGRYSAVEVADPTSFKAAIAKCTERLNEYLTPHGIEIREVVTPKPLFDAEYEKAIEERKEADQEVERLKVYEEQLMQQRGRVLATVEKDKEIEWQMLQGDLIKAKLGAEKEQIRIEKAADAYKIGREAEGEAEKSKFLAEAEGMRAKYTKEAEGILARATALEKRGHVVVREAVIKKLAEIRFTLVPYNRDPSPRRLELIGATEASNLIDQTVLGGGNQ